MSLSLNWYEPPAKPTSIDGCRHPLKGILAERYLGNDGSLYGEFMLGREDLPYLQGLVDADVENVVIYGEGYGAGIQKGGGLYSAFKKFIVFDVFVIDPVGSKLGGWWLSDANVHDIADKLGLDAVPYIGEMTLEEAALKVRQGFMSALNGGQAGAEGMVGRPIEALFDKKGHRLIVKLKTKDFAV